MLRFDSVELENLHECLILGFAYERRKHRFTIVSDYPDRLSKSDRDLIAIVFNDVNEFVREAGDLPKLRQFRYRYAAKDEVGARVFQYIETRPQDQEPNYVRFWFGPNLGGISFHYGKFEAYIRRSRIIEIGKEPIYFDAATNEEFDFYYPFPDLLNDKPSKN